MDATTRLIDLTVGELQTLIAREVKCILQEQTAPEPRPATQQDTTLYGIKGIAEALHCSLRQAQRMKSEGLLEGGYQQIGKGIIIKSAQALRDIAERSLTKHKRTTKRLTR